MIIDENQLSFAHNISNTITFKTTNKHPFPHNNRPKRLLLYASSYLSIGQMPCANEESPEVRAKVLKDIKYDANDPYPSGMPAPHGQPMQISVFIDLDHAGNIITRRLHTGMIIYLNLVPIIWFSKKQNNVKSLTFGAKFIAAKTALEIVKGLIYKLRILGVPLEGPARFFCDNEAVVKSGSYPEIISERKPHP